MLTPQEARELMANTSKPKFSLSNVKLVWMCGRINSLIEKSAALGKPFVFIVYDEEIAQKYFKYLAKLYEEQGYCVAYNTEKRLSCTLPVGFGVYWAISELSPEEGLAFNNCNYHTPMGKTYIRGLNSEKLKEAIEIAKDLIKESRDARDHRHLFLRVDQEDAMVKLTMCGEEVVNFLETGAKLQVSTKIDFADNKKE